MFQKQAYLFLFLFSLTNLVLAQSPLTIKKDGKWGAINQEGKIIIQPEYEFIGSFGKVTTTDFGPEEYWAYFRQNGQTGVINGKGEVVIKAEYEKAKIFPNGLVTVWQNGKAGMIVGGELTVQPEYDMVEPLAQFSNLLRTAFKGKFGVSNQKGEVIHSCIFDRLDIGTQSSSLTTATQNGKFGVLNTDSGELILPCEFDKVEVSKFKAVGYKLKQILEVDVDEVGTIKNKKTYNNQTDFELTKKREENEKIKELLTKNPEMNRPQWQKDGFRYKLVSPFGKKLISQEFFALSQEPELGLSVGILENDEKQLECYLIDDKQAKILFMKQAKDMVLSDFLQSDYARISLDTLWDGLVNKSGEVIEKVNGRDITNIGNFQDKRAAIQFGGSFGYINDKAQLVIPSDFDIVSDFVDGYAIARKGGRFGCIDVSGKPIIPFQHDGIAPPDGNLIRLKKGRGRTGKWGLYTLDGKEVLPQEYSLIDEFVEDQAIILQNGKYGIIDRKGNIILQPSIEVDRMYPFKNGIAQVGNELMVENIKGVPKRRYKYNGFVDKKGNFIIEPKYDYIFDFDSVWEKGSGLAQIIKGDFVGYVDAKGKEVVAPKYAGIQEFEKVWEAGEGLAKILSSDGKFGYIDHRGNQVLNPAFSSVEGFEACLADTNVWARASDNGKFGFINYKGETKISFIYDNISLFMGETAIVKKDGKYGLINRSNEVVMPIEYDGIRFLENSDKKFLTVYKKNPTYFYFNGKGEVVRSEAVTKSDGAKSEGTKNNKYKYLTDFDENGLAIIEDDGEKGLADKNGKVIVKPQYKELGGFSDGLAYFRVSHKDRNKMLYGYINTSGKEVIAATFKDARNFNDGKAAVYKSRWGYIDKSGKLVIPYQFRQADEFSGGYAVVNDNEIIDATGKKVGSIGLEGKVISGFSSDRAILQTLSGNFHIKPDGMPAYYAKYDEVSDFVGGTAFVKRGEKWVLTRKAGETETKVPFSRASKNAYLAEFGERYLRKTPFGEIKDVKWTLVEDGIWRMIDQNGNLVSETLYDDVLGKTADGLLKVRKDGFVGVADLNGKFISPAQNDVITSVGDNLLKIEYQGKIGYLKADGSWVWELK